MSDDEKDEEMEEEKEEEGGDKAEAKKPTSFPLPKDKPRFEVKKWQGM